MKVVVRVRVETSVHPTENAAKVKAACMNVFPDLVLTEEGTRLIGEGADLERFRELVRNQKIRDTAREILIRGRRAGTLQFTLGKQPAAAGRVNFAVGAPLGDLAVTVEDDDLDTLIDHVAESTVGHRLTTRDLTTRDRTSDR